MTKCMHPRSIMEKWRPGSAEWTWPEEAVDVIGRDPAGFAALLTDIHKNGVLEPVLLGDDGRVWDGHHRVLAALLAARYVPYKTGTGGRPVNVDTSETRRMLAAAEAAGRQGRTLISRANDYTEAAWYALPVGVVLRWAGYVPLDMPTMADVAVTLTESGWVTAADGRWQDGAWVQEQFERGNLVIVD